MVAPLILLPFLSLLLLFALPVHPDEISMENTPAYTTAFDTNLLCTAYAVIPSASFKSIYCRDYPSDPAPCICTNKTLSTEFRLNIWNYCVLNTVRSTTTQSTGRETETPTKGGTLSITVSTSTAGESAGQSTAPGEGQGGLTADGKASVIVGVVVRIIGIVILLIGHKLSWYSKAWARLKSQGWLGPAHVSDVHNLSVVYTIFYINGL